MTKITLFETDTDDAVAFLNGLRKDVERLKNASNQPDGSVQLLRSFADQALASDSMTASEDTSPVGVYGTDNYGFTQYGNGGLP